MEVTVQSGPYVALGARGIVVEVMVQSGPYVALEQKRKKKMKKKIQ